MVILNFTNLTTRINHHRSYISLKTMETGILLQSFSFYIPSDGELISMCDEKNIYKEGSTLVRKDIVQAFRGFVSEDIVRMCSN